MDENSIILFSKGDVLNWRGLPQNLFIEEFIKIFGSPSETCEEALGYYPAVKYYFTAGNMKGGLIAFVREQNVVFIETRKLPVSGILNELPEPAAILPHEILMDKAYAAEFIYPERGLNLTVAKHFDKNIADKIIRCRGFEKMRSPSEFDARYYKSFEDSMLW